LGKRVNCFVINKYCICIVFRQKGRGGVTKRYGVNIMG
jgi:hypothetical protein